MVLVVKNLPADAGDTRDAGSNPGWGRSPGVGRGNPLQYSCLDRRAWRATVNGVAKSLKQLKQLSTDTYYLWIFFSCKNLCQSFYLWVTRSLEIKQGINKSPNGWDLQNSWIHNFRDHLDLKIMLPTTLPQPGNSNFCHSSSLEIGYWPGVTRCPNLGLKTCGHREICLSIYTLSSLWVFKNIPAPTSLTWKQSQRLISPGAETQFPESWIPASPCPLLIESSLWVQIESIPW